MTELRCGNCNHWLGEAAVALIMVEHIDKDENVRVSPPRDVRLCKSCGRKSVYIKRDDLDTRRQPKVACG